MSNKNILALITNMSVTLNLVVPDGLVSLGRSIEGGGISRLPLSMKDLQFLRYKISCIYLIRRNVHAY